MQQASQKYDILDCQAYGNSIQQKYYMINNCLDKIARKANVDEITKIQKLDKYQNLKKTFGTSNLTIQVPIDLIQLGSDSYYIEHKYDCDVEQLIKIDAFNLDAFTKFIYVMFSALNQLHQSGIKHGNIDTFSIGYYSQRYMYLQQFVLMDFSLIDKSRSKNLKNEESISQDYHDLGRVFLNILLKQQYMPNINCNDQLLKLKQSNELNKYYDLIQRMLTNKTIDPLWHLDQLNDNLRPQLIVDQLKFQKYQQQLQLSKRSFNINGYRHTNPANLPQLNQQFNNQINRQSLPNNLQSFANNLNKNINPLVIQQQPQQLQLMNQPHSIRQQAQQINQYQGKQIIPTQIQTITNPQIQSNQPMPQPFVRQVQGFSNAGVDPLRLQRQQGK